MCSDNQFTVDVAVTVLVDKMDDRLLCVIACIFVTLGGCRQCTQTPEPSSFAVVKVSDRHQSLS